MRALFNVQFLKYLKNWGIKTRLLFSFFVSALILVAVAVFTVKNITGITEKQNQLAQEYKKIDYLSEVEQMYRKMASGIRSYLIIADAESLKPFSDTEEVLAKFLSKGEAIFADEPEQVKRLVGIKALLQQWVSAAAVNEMLARRKLSAEFITLDQFALEVKNGKGAVLSAKLLDAIYQAKKIQEDKVNQVFVELDTLSASVVNLTIVGLIAFLISSMLIQGVVAGRIGRSTGDQVAELKQSKGQLDLIKNALADQGDHITKQADSVAEAVQSTSSALTEISSMIDLTTKNSVTSAELAKNSRNNAEDAQKRVTNLSKEFQSLNETINELLAGVRSGIDQFKDIQRTISAINEKTQVINEISFQTKLLSFNASIEAARAGDRGKGFSVVAQEVGNLARVSDDSAREISEIIESSVRQVDSVITSFSENVSGLASDTEIKTQKGQRLVDESTEVLTQILRDSEETSVSVENITSAVHEQSAGIKNITENIQGVDYASKQNKNLVNDLKTEVNKLHQASDVLGTAMSSIQKIVSGKDDSKAA